MLSKTIIEKNRIYAVCEKSGDILPNATFRGARLAARSGIDFLPTDAAIVCYGRISDSELLFRTADGRYYFSICDGWGAEDGVLYGLRAGIFCDFGHPMSPEMILEDCEELLGSYHTWGGAMAYHGRKRMLDRIREVVRNEGAPTAK